MKFRMRSPSHVRANAQNAINGGGTTASSTTLDSGTNFRTIGTTLGTAA